MGHKRPYGPRTATDGRARRFALPVTLIAAALALAVTGSAFASGPPVVSGTTVSFSTVTATAATLTASVNPSGDATSYHFEYGPAPCDASSCTSTPAQNAGSGSDPISASQPIAGLDAATTYHFRIVATNSADTTAGPDATFTTYSSAPSFPLCPNDSLRTGPGARLPDCRAYEQASPVDKDGGDAEGDIAVQASAAGDAVTFANYTGLPGGVGAQNNPIFLARRAAGAWSTQGLFPPASFGNVGTVLGWTPDLTIALDHATTSGVASGPPGVVGGRLIARSMADGSNTSIFSSTSFGIAGAFAGASADDSKLFVEANSTPGLTPDSAPGKDNLYVFDRDTDSLNLVGILPAAQGGTAPPGGSFAGSYDWWGAKTATPLGSDGGAMKNYFTQAEHAISSGGDKAYFTAGVTGQLYLRQGLTGPTPSTVQVNASQKTTGSGPGGTDGAGQAPAAFMAATPDGSNAFFTSSEKLTNDANTGPELPYGPPAIGRATLDGTTDVNATFLPTTAAAVAVDGAHIYWTDPSDNTIGRANLDGTSANPSFIANANNPRSVAVDGSFVYWTNATTNTNGQGAIGRANLDGSGANPSFISGASNPQGIAVDATHIYWANVGTTAATRRLGRALLNGSSATQTLTATGTTAASSTPGVAVDGNGVTGHVYWANANNISRANLDGTGASLSFITGASTPKGIAVDANFVYWANSASNAIGRATIAGATPNQSFIAGAGLPQGLAVDASHLYWVDHQQAQHNPGNDLYRYDAATGALADLAPDPTDVNGADVKGVLGTSDDGAYVYFAANGDLDGSGPATLGSCQRSGAGLFDYSGTCNLYLAHNGDSTFIAQLDSAGGVFQSDAANWQPTPLGDPSNDLQLNTARVSADGHTVLFRSQRQLSAYDNATTTAGTNCGEGSVGSRCPELYRYHAGDPAPTCVSCNPTGAPPTGRTTLQSALLQLGLGVSILTRNLSADGDRIFFETRDRLLVADTNGNGGCPPEIVAGLFFFPSCQDVYEWEADGAGSCDSAAADGGCLYLLSTGTSTSPSYFADASASGNDAFLITRDPLVPQDADQLTDVYDAGGGLASQHAVASAGCSGDACQGGSAPAPALPTAATVTFAGSGNATPPRRGSTPKKVSVSKPKPVTGWAAKLRVNAPAVGLISVAGVWVRHTSRKATRPGSVTIVVRLTDKARRSLARHDTLRARVRVGFKPKNGSASAATVVLTFRSPRHTQRSSSEARTAITTRRAGL